MPFGRRKCGNRLLPSFPSRCIYALWAPQQQPIDASSWVNGCICGGCSKRFGLVNGLFSRILVRFIPGTAMFAKLSADANNRSARLAGIGLMLLGIFLFSFGDALGKFIVGTYSVGQLLLLAQYGIADPGLTADLAVSGAVRHFAAARTAGSPGGSVHGGSRGVFRRSHLSAARRHHHVLPRRSDLRDGGSRVLPWRACRLAAMGRDRGGIQRRPDRAATVSADHQLASTHRARRQHIVCGPDAGDAFAAGHAGYGARLEPVRRHACVRWFDRPTGLGDAVIPAPWLVLACRLFFRWRSVSA